MNLRSLQSTQPLDSTVKTFRVWSSVFLGLALGMLFLAVIALGVIVLKITCAISGNVDVVVNSLIGDLKTANVGEVFAALATLGFLASTLYVYYSGRFYSLLDKYPSIDVQVFSEGTNFFTIRLENDGNLMARDINIEVRSESEDFTSEMSKAVQRMPHTLRPGQVHKIKEIRYPHFERFEIEVTFAVAIDRLRQFNRMRVYKSTVAGKLKEVYE